MRIPRRTEMGTRQSKAKTLSHKTPPLPTSVPSEKKSWYTSGKDLEDALYLDPIDFAKVKKSIRKLKIDVNEPLPGGYGSIPLFVTSNTAQIRSEFSQSTDDIFDFITWLIEKKKADPNKIDPRTGDTPLHLAVESCHGEHLTEWLISLGASVYAPNAGKRFPYQNGHVKMIPIVEKYMYRGGSVIEKPPQLVYQCIKVINSTQSEKEIADSALPEELKSKVLGMRDGKHPANPNTIFPEGGEQERNVNNFDPILHGWLAVVSSNEKRKTFIDLLDRITVIESTKTSEDRSSVQGDLKFRYKNPSSVFQITTNVMTSCNGSIDAQVFIYKLKEDTGDKEKLLSITYSLNACIGSDLIPYHCVEGQPRVVAEEFEMSTDDVIPLLAILFSLLPEGCLQMHKRALAMCPIILRCQRLMKNFPSWYADAMDIWSYGSFYQPKNNPAIYDV